MVLTSLYFLREFLLQLGQATDPAPKGPQEEYDDGGTAHIDQQAKFIVRPCSVGREAQSPPPRKNI